MWSNIFFNLMEAALANRKLVIFFTIALILLVSPIELPPFNGHILKISTEQWVTYQRLLGGLMLQLGGMIAAFRKRH